jgi:hypothetical protein
MSQDHGTHRLISAGMWQFDLRNTNYGMRVGPIEMVLFSCTALVPDPEKSLIELGALT